MKKRIMYFTLLFIIILICIGCTGNEGNNTNQAGNISEDSGTGGDSVIESSTEPSNQEGVYYWFYSYEEWDEWIQLDEYGYAPIMEDMELHGPKYKAFVEGIITGERKIAKPYWGEELMPLIPRGSGFPCIQVQDYNQGRVHVWYIFKGSQTRPRIKIMNMTEEEMEYAQNHSIEEFYRYIISNWDGEGVWSTDVLELQDRTVSILTREDTKLEGGIMVSFIYDNMYVVISIDEDDFNAMDWTQFSLRTE